MHGVNEGRPPQLDLDVEKTLQDTVLAAIREGLVQSAHDLSDGGFAVALAESCISGEKGAVVNLQTELRADITLFSESQSRILLSAKPAHAARLQQLLSE